MKNDFKQDFAEILKGMQLSTKESEAIKGGVSGCFFCTGCIISACVTCVGCVQETDGGSIIRDGGK